MTLSLDDVRNKRFRMARKGGYEVLEVDEFVDEVEESFAQLFEENASLKKQLEALRSGSSDEPAAAQTQVRTPESRPEPAAQPSPSQPAPAQAAPSAPVAEERIVVTTSNEASTAVVRLVQLSTEQAEHLVREATAEAAHIREDATSKAQQVTEDARTRAERLESEARVNAERVQAEAQSRSQSLDQELTQRRTELFGDLDRQRDTLTETVARLRDFEQRYRSSLHDHLQGQLSTLQQVGLEPEGGPERTAPRSASAAQEEPQADGQNGSAATQTGSQPAQGDGPATGSPTSDTPRLDALLGEQR
jgi:DivIVA domain-containing protein